MADLEARLQSAVGDAYRIEHELGGGGMSRVFLATEMALGRLVVIKVLPPELAAEINVERFRREIHLLANLQHPHIVPLLTAGAVEGLLYYTMPYVEGDSLRSWLRSEAEIPIVESVRILRDVADALTHAHGRGILHRDIKPDNVLVSDKHALVTDFGVSKAMTSATGDVTLTATGVAPGTPVYMAPEQGAGDPATDHRADIYSFGAVGYELITGRPPFEGRSAQQLLSAHALHAPVPVHERREGVAPELAALIMRCLEKRPEDRPQTAAEVQRTLESMAQTDGIGKSDRPQRRRTSSKRRSRLLAVLALGLVAVGAFAAYRRYSLQTTTAESRVIVTPLVNRTGDARYDPVGELASDWITRGLAETGIVDVVPFSPKRDGAGRVIESELTAATLAVEARKLSVGRVVSGAFYGSGDSLQFYVRITDAEHGGLVETIAPSTAAKREPMAGINAVSVRVMGALAQLSGSELRGLASADVPPTYEAFREFVRGENAFAVGDFKSARANFEHAFALDSSYLTPLVRLAYVFVNTDQCETTDSLGRVLNSKRDRLSPFQAASLDRVLAWCAGNTEDAYVAATKMLSAAPHSSFAQYAVGRQAFKLNRPREAVQRFESLGWLGTHRPGYYDDLTIALHKLGEHERELQVAKVFVERNPGSLQPLVPYVRALSALGRVDDVRQVVKGTLSSPPGLVRSPADVIATATLELRAHGHPREASEMAELLVGWVRQHTLRTPDEALLTRALMLAERYPEALVAARRMPRRNPFELSLALGFEGTSAAAVGDIATAERLSVELAAIKAPYLDGGALYWQAAIAARLARRERAVSLLRGAIEAGNSQVLFSDGLAEFLSLRGYPPYDELVKPKG